MKKFFLTLAILLFSFTSAFAVPYMREAGVKAVVVNGVCRAWKYHDSSSNIVRIDIFNDAAVTDYGSPATVGSIAWAISALTASGEIYLSQGTYHLDTGLSLDGKSGISIIGSSIKYSASKLSADSAITMLSMNKSRYCKISNLIFSGADIATKGVYCYASDAVGGTNFENVFEDIMFEDFIRGLEMGTTDNYQASENTLRNVIFSSNTTGLYLRGYNTLNITLYSCKFEGNGTHIDSSAGNFVAYSPLFVTSITRDILLGASQRQVVIVGGQTEQGEKALEIAASGSNLGYTFIGFSFIADSSSSDATFISDDSLMPATFIDCRFTYGAGATFGGFGSVPSSEKVPYKNFINCIWRDNDFNAVAPIIAGAQTNVLVAHSPKPILPATQTIASGNTISANACGLVKKITASGAVTTDTTNTFTAPADYLDGCVMDVVNIGSSAITLDNNSNFVSAGGADVVLGAGDSIRVICTGASGKWYQIGATGNN